MTSKRLIARASPVAYVAVLGIIGFCVTILVIASADDTSAPIVRAVSVLAFILAFMWLRAFRISVDDRGLEFHSLFEGTRGIAWRDIEHIRVSIEFEHPLRGPLRLRVTPRKDSGIEILGVNAKVFDSSSIRDVLLHWEKWKSDSMADKSDAIAKS